MHHPVLTAAALLLTALVALPADAQPTGRPAAPARPAAAPTAAPASGARAAPGRPVARPVAAAGAPAASAAKPAKPTARARVLRKSVGLSEERAAKVEGIIDRHAADKRKAQDEIRAARRELRELLRADSDDQKAYNRALDRLRSGHRALQSVRDRELDALRRELQPKEQARLLGTFERLKRQAAARNARRPAPRR